MPVSPRPTHFLALPLHTHAALRALVASYQGGLLRQAIAGLDKSIVIDPRRLHFTLGVMALQDDAQIAAALALLQSLKDDIARVLEGLNSVTARLDHMGVFKIEKHKFANVLYVGPSQEALESESGRRLTALCDLVRDRFRAAGYITETRPLQLHCTLLNTSHRRPFRRQPFEFAGMLRDMDFGSYEITEIGLWKMGSHSPVDNSYISVGSMAL